MGLAASLITFSSLWAAAGIVPTPSPPAVVNGEGDEKEGEARTMVETAEPYSVELDTATSSYVEVKDMQV